MTASATPVAGQPPRGGIAFGIAAFTWWGLVPIYFKSVAHVAPLEVLAHRTIWSLVLLGIGMLIITRGRGLLAPLLRPRTALLLGATTVLIATNWFVFIWAITHGQTVQASLGYFINPLFNVLLGVVFLGERLRRLQVVSVLLAATGVGWHALSHGTIPTVALLLVASFGLYGLLRKRADVAGPQGLLLEVLLLAPFALGYLGWLGAHGTLAFANVSRATDGLLMLGGVMTAVPLLWFVEAARRLRLVTLGFLQYIAPSLQLMCGTVLFGEPFTRDLVITFVLIWGALAVFSYDAVRATASLRLSTAKAS